MTSVYKSLREFVPAAIVLAVLFPLLGGQIGPGLLVLPLLFGFQIMMNVGIALLVSTYVVLVPDGSNLMSYVNRILFFATPVMYPVALLPANVKALLQWQPLFPLFACTRQSQPEPCRASPWSWRRAFGRSRCSSSEGTCSSSVSASSRSIFENSKKKEFEVSDQTGDDDGNGTRPTDEDGEPSPHGAAIPLVDREATPTGRAAELPRHARNTCRASAQSGGR